MLKDQSKTPACGLLRTDLLGRLSYVSSAAAEVLGVAATAVVGRPLHDVLRLFDIDTAEPVDYRASSSGDSLAFARGPGPFLLIRPDGTERCVDVAVSAGRDSDGDLLVVIVDKTYVSELEARLQWIAEHDPTTGLIAKTAFLRELDSAVREAGSEVAAAQLLLARVYGEGLRCAAAEPLLRVVASAITSVVKETDIVGRPRDDAIGVIRRGTHESAMTVANAMIQAVSRVRFSWGDMIFPTSLRIVVIPMAVSIDDPSFLVSSAYDSCPSRDAGTAVRALAANALEDEFAAWRLRARLG